MSQLKRDQDARQRRIEEYLATLGTFRALLEHDALRVKQAIRRTGQDCLLSPVLYDFDQIQQSIEHIQDALRQEWDSGQSDGWK